jgi:NAD(P)-dependent dehydrogenase (short-subunit alcohol dehydrogenase family)/acyl carrier protein
VASFHSLIYIAQALGDAGPASPCRLAVVTKNLHEVSGEEDLQPLQALSLGPVTVIPQEYAHLSCFNIDLDLADPERQVGWLAADVSAISQDSPIIAYRGSRRWAQAFVPTGMPASPPPLRSGGVYLLVGGLGGVGMALAECLARSAEGVKLVLTGRRPSLDSARFLRETGAEVLVLPADVADLESMRTVIARTRQQFGGLHGVVHAAGIAGGGTIQTKAFADSEREFAAKVGGSFVLASLLLDEPLDFWVLCSSYVSSTGGLGQVAYCAANAFQDHWAEAMARRHAATKIVAIDWERWKQVGMAVAAGQRYHELTGRALDGGMSAQEGGEAFARILASAPMARVVVSTQDFPALVRQSRVCQLGLVNAVRKSQASHSRPHLASGYAAPTDETQSLLVAIWQEELGIAPVGILDDFFALGGDSLLAIKLVNRVRLALDVPLNVRTFYDAPTIAALAELAQSLRWAAVAGIPSGFGAELEEEGGIL